MGEDVAEGEFVGDPLGTAEVRHYDEGAAACEHLLQGRHRRTDAGVVGNFEILIEGNVEVNAYDGFFAGEIVRINVLLHSLEL